VTGRRERAARTSRRAHPTASRAACASAGCVATSPLARVPHSRGGRGKRAAHLRQPGRVPPFRAVPTTTPRAPASSSVRDRLAVADAASQPARRRPSGEQRRDHGDVVAAPGRRIGGPDFSEPKPRAPVGAPPHGIGIRTARRRTSRPRAARRLPAQVPRAGMRSSRSPEDRGRAAASAAPGTHALAASLFSGGLHAQRAPWRITEAKPVVLVRLFAATTSDSSPVHQMKKRTWAKYAVRHRAAASSGSGPHRGCSSPCAAGPRAQFAARGPGSRPSLRPRFSLSSNSSIQPEVRCRCTAGLR